MSKQIYLRFNELKARKERLEEKRYSLREIAEATKKIDEKLGITEKAWWFDSNYVRFGDATKRKTPNLGISVTTLNKISQNKSRAPHLTTLNLLCEFFECDIADLLVRE